MKLKASGKQFYKDIMVTWDITDAHDIKKLILACRCLDEIDQDEKTVGREGRIIKDRFGQAREHPASRAIRENKILFCRIVRELNLSPDPQESRPPGLTYWGKRNA